jgi:hypothetical protein
MRKSIVMMMAGLVLAATLANGQEESRRAMAEELLNCMNMRETTEKSFAMVKRMIPSQFENMQRASGQTNSTASVTNQMNAMMDLVSEELSWDKLKGDYISLYADTFSNEELQGLITFYKSPAGQAFLKKQPELMKRSMELSQRMMRQVMPKLQAMGREPAPAPAPAPAQVPPTELKPK